jgi:diketogulonate reductase-like aldo/keto reductase
MRSGFVVIPKSSKPERIAESVGAFDVSLSDAQMARLDALNDPRRGTAASVAEHLKIIAAKEYVKDLGSDGKT